MWPKCKWMISQKIDEETELETFDMESWKYQLQMVERSYLMAQGRDRILQKCFCWALYGNIEIFVAKGVWFRCTEINQQRRLGLHKLEAKNSCEKRSDGRHLVKLIGISPNTSKSYTEKLQRGANQARRRFPICETEKVQCLHWDALTLTSRDSNADCCKNCGCSLP